MLPILRTRELGRVLCEILAYVHAQGVIHRDVKPANILIAPSGQPVLTDFGVAQEPGEAPGALVGTAAYAAPEQLANGVIDARADQYALGGTLYFLLTGQRPFSAEDPAALARAHLERLPDPPSARDPTVPVDLDSVLMRMLAKDPALRFPDLGAVAAALGRPRPEGFVLSGRQPAVDAVARALDEVAQGHGQALRVVGSVGAGRHWLMGLAREAATRRGLHCVATDDAEIATQAAARIQAGEALLLVTPEPVPAADVLLLPPLTLAEVRRSVYSLAPRTPDLAVVAERLHRETGGNPGLLLRTLDRYLEDDAVRLPEVLSVDVTPWLWGLDPDELAVAGVLATLTTPSESDPISDIAQVPAESVLPALDARGVACAADGRWVLAAEMLRAPIQALLPDPEGLQERIRELQILADEDQVTDPIAVAAEELIQEGRLSEASELLKQNLDAAVGEPRAARLLAMGRVHWELGASARAWAAYAEALGVARRPVTRARACIGVGISAVQVGHLGASIDHFSQAVTESSLADDPLRQAVALVNLAESRSSAGELAEARRCARRALAISRGLRHRRMECVALRHIGQVYLDLGQATEALHVLADASALARALRLPGERIAAHVLRATATLEERPGDKIAAAAAIDRLHPLLLEAPGPDPEGFQLRLRCTWALATAIIGDRRQYQRAWSEALAAADEHRVTIRLRAGVQLASAAWYAGDIQDAARQAERVANEAYMRGFILFGWEAARIQARVLGRTLPARPEMSAGLEPAEIKALEGRG